MNFKKQLELIIEIFDQFQYSEIQLSLNHSIELIKKSLDSNKKIMLCGNGGSAADSMHIAAEMVGKFKTENRKAINFLSLNANQSILTAWSNDVSFDSIFERQVEAHGEMNDVLIILSTSGKSNNVIKAAIKAKEMGIKLISLTGNNSSILHDISDVNLIVPSTETPRIQEIHIMMYHYICQEIEKLYS